MTKHLRLNGGVFRNEAYLVQIKLPRQHRSRYAHLRRALNAREIMYAHLGACVDRHVGQGCTHRADKPHVLHDKPVGSEVARKAGRADGPLDLAVVHEGVERDVHPAAAYAAVAHGFFKFIIRKVFCPPAGVEVAHSQIYGVRSVLNGGDNGLRRSGGRKQFYHFLQILLA